MTYVQHLAQLDAEYQLAASRILEAYNRNKALVDRRLRELNAYLNALSPISALPPELLCAIFLEYTSVCWERFRSQRKETRSCPPYPWMTLAHVCQHWRDVTMQTPMLWTCIAPFHTEIVDFEISHTKNLPLTILHTPNITPGSLGRAFSHLSHIATWELVVTPRVLDVLSNNLSTPHTNCTHLTDLDIDITLDDAETDRVMPFFSNLDMPRITSLSASGSSLRSLCTLMRPTLTRLYLAPYWQRYHDIIIFLDTLLSVPSLEVLSVRFPKLLPQPQTQAPMSPYSRVSLPRLTTLQLFDHDTGVLPAKLLSYLAFPASCTIQFWQRATGRAPLDDDESDLITSSIARTLSAPDFALAFRPRAISLVNNDHDDSACLGVWTEERMLREMHTPCWWVPGDASFLALHAKLPQLIGKVLPMFNLADTTIVHVAACLAPSVWQHIFNRAAKLEKLEVRGNDAVYALMAVFDGQNSESATHPGDTFASNMAMTDDRTQPLFPALRTLILKSLDFGVEKQPSQLLARIGSSLVSRRTTDTPRSAMLDKLVLDSIRRVSEVDIEYLSNAQVAKILVVNNVEYCGVRSKLTALHRS